MLTRTDLPRGCTSAILIDAEHFAQGYCVEHKDAQHNKRKERTYLRDDHDYLNTTALPEVPHT